MTFQSLRKFRFGIALIAAVAVITSALLVTRIARMSDVWLAILLGATLLLCAVGVFCIILLARAPLRGAAQRGFEILLEHPRKLLAITFAFLVAYAAGLYVLKFNLADAVQTTLDILFAIQSPASVAPAASGSHAESLLAIGLRWSGWLAVGSWAIVLPALLAIFIDEAGETMPAGHGDPLRLSTSAGQFVTTYSTTIGALMRATIGVPPSKRPQVIVELLRGVTGIARFLLKPGERATINASYSVLRKGADFVPRDTAVLYDDRYAGLIEYVLEVAQWAYEVPQLRGRGPILLAVDRLKPVPGGPAAIVHDRVEVIYDAQDATCWKEAGLDQDGIESALRYFATVPFRSFISMPIGPAAGGASGVLTIQVDLPGVFRANTPAAKRLLEQLEPFRVLLGSIEGA